MAQSRRKRYKQYLSIADAEVPRTSAKRAQSFAEPSETENTSTAAKRPCTQQEPALSTAAGENEGASTSYDPITDLWQATTEDERVSHDSDNCSVRSVNSSIVFSDDENLWMESDSSDDETEFEPLLSSASLENDGSATETANGTPPGSEDQPNKPTVFTEHNLDDIPDVKVGLTKFEILVMILHFGMRYGLTDVAVRSLIKMVNTILGAEVIPPSNHIFQKIFSSPTSQKYFLYCSRCMCSLGLVENCKGVTSCKSCKAPVDPDNLNDNNFFIGLSIKDQIKDLLEGPNGESILTYKKNRVADENHISDVFDGLLYRELDEKHNQSNENTPYLTLNLATDGAPIFRSSGRSLWAIQFYINELPPKERFMPSNLLLAAVWVGVKTPSMITYCSFLLDELIMLATTGLEFERQLTKLLQLMKVYALFFIVDLPAKAKIVNMIQYNGQFGCLYCLHPGTPLPNSNNQIRYEYMDAYPRRTDAQIREDMKKAEANKKLENGMRSESILSFVPHFQFPFAVVLDWLHSHLIGVTKYLCQEIWMNSSYSGEEFYLDNKKVALIDKRMKLLQPPANISRDVRLLSTNALWKANEWKWWVWFYGPICLYRILPPRYYNHFCLLSAALFFFNQAHIPRDEIATHGGYLSLFVMKFQDLYSIVHMTYNVHSSEHIRETVVSCGPLWSFSAFLPESGNNFLLKLVKGAKGVAQQITRRYCTFASIPKFVAPHLPMNDEVIQFCDSIMSFRCFKQASKFNNITTPGNKFRCRFIPSPEEVAIMTQELSDIDLDAVFFIKKIIYRGTIFTSLDILQRRKTNPRKNEPKRNNSYAVLTDGRIFKIHKLFICSRDYDITYALGRFSRKEIDKRSVFNIKDIHLKCYPLYAFEKRLSIIPAENFSEKCFFMSVDGENVFMSAFPNNIERD